jgi:hypothetical protein
MSKGFKGQGAYNTDRGDGSCFEPDKSFFKGVNRAGEGSGKKNPSHPDYAGGRTAGKPNVDPDLEYVNSGPRNRKEKSWQ